MNKNSRCIYRDNEYQGVNTPIFTSTANEYIDNVYYPGLESHLNHDIAKSQMIGGFGGMLSFEFKDDSIVTKFLENLVVVKPTLSLGGVESIICQPSLTSHLKMSKEDRDKLNITDGLLRLSVGIEIC